MRKEEVEVKGSRVCMGAVMKPASHGGMYGRRGESYLVFVLTASATCECCVCLSVVGRGWPPQ